MAVSPKLALGAWLASIIYFALTVLGAGGLARFFSHPPLIAIAIALLVMSAISPFSQASVSPGVREDRSNRWVFIPFTLYGLLAAYLPAYTDRKEFWTLDGDTVRWIGVAAVSTAPFAIPAI
jgi:hypothetical protein